MTALLRARARRAAPASQPLDSGHGLRQGADMMTKTNHAQKYFWLFR